LPLQQPLVVPVETDDQNAFGINVHSRPVAEPNNSLTCAESQLNISREYPA
jgi:hypothetical protein